MTWLNGKLAEFGTILVTIFGLIVAGVSIKLLWERKTIAIMLFVLTAGLLGWFVINPKGAVDTITKIWQ